MPDEINTNPVSAESEEAQEDINALLESVLFEFPLTEVRISGVHELRLGQEFGFTAAQRHMIALDGERELRVDPGNEVSFSVHRNGPWRVLPRAALSEAVRLGMFRQKKEGS